MPKLLLSWPTSPSPSSSQATRRQPIKVSIHLVERLFAVVGAREEFAGRRTKRPLMRRRDASEIENSVQRGGDMSAAPHEKRRVAGAAIWHSAADWAARRICIRPLRRRRPSSVCRASKREQVVRKAPPKQATAEREDNDGRFGRETRRLLPPRNTCGFSVFVCFLRVHKIDATIAASCQFISAQRRRRRRGGATRFQRHAQSGRRPPRRFICLQWERAINRLYERLDWRPR